VPCISRIASPDGVCRICGSGFGFDVVAVLAYGDLKGARRIGIPSVVASALAAMPDRRGSG
jgi:hypothetical protein